MYIFLGLSPNTPFATFLVYILAKAVALFLSLPRKNIAAFRDWDPPLVLACKSQGRRDLLQTADDEGPRLTS